MGWPRVIDTSISLEERYATATSCYMNPIETAAPTHQTTTINAEAEV